MIKRPISSAVMAAVALAFAGGVYAADGDSSDNLQEVVVTGSRIATTQMAAYQPVTVLTSDAIESVGTTNIATTLRDLPEFGTSGLSSANSNFLTNDSGVNTIDLRNLGDSRTLVLVNGRRMTPGLATSTTVDLNTIPTDFIDHVEISTGGASAIYGSDAMAGAVNIILKKDLDGIQFHAQAGESSEADAQNWVGGMTFGTSLADGRGHIMFNASYNKDYGLNSADRTATATDLAVTASGVTNPQYSSYIPGGNFFYNSSAGGFGNNANTPSGNFYFDPSGNFVNQGFCACFNRSAYRLIDVPIDRTLLSTVINYDLTDHNHFYTELTYSDGVSHSQIEPTPLAASGVNSVYGGALDANGDTIGVPITNWYLNNTPALAPIVQAIQQWNTGGYAGSPGALDPANVCTGSAATNPAYDCINYLTFRRRLTDIGPRGNDSTRQTFRVVLGVNGELPFGDWKYDASYVYGRTTDAQTSHGAVNLNNFANALNSVAGPNGQPVCADPVAVAQGCVPINIFGPNTISAAAAAYVAAPITYNGLVAEGVATAYLTGSLFPLPAGNVSLVVGGEERKDKSSQQWDPLTNAGLNGSNALPNVFGSLNVYEAFAETEIPLIKDAPGAHMLKLNGAFRFANYSDGGSANSWKIGLNWAPTADFGFRGVYSVAVRAPNIGDLFGGQSQTFPPGIFDPCDGVSATTTGTVATNCRAIPAIAAAIAASPTHTFAYTALDYQQIFGLQGSNPNLQPEQAKTKTVGIVVTPTALPGFQASVDWFDITVFGAVNSINFETSIQDCITLGQFCGNVVRNAATGKIQELFQLSLNVGYIRSAGVDTSIRYGFNAGPGRVTMDLEHTYQLKLEQAVPGAPVEIDLGQLNSGGRLGAGFRNRANFSLTYALAGFDVDYKLNFLGPIQDTNQENGGPVFQQFNNVPAYFYHDLQLSYKFGSSPAIQAYVGANNLFNKKPPFLPGQYASDVTGTNTAADSYDVIGIFLYAGARVKF